MNRKIKEFASQYVETAVFDNLAVVTATSSMCSNYWRIGHKGEMYPRGGVEIYIIVAIFLVLGDTDFTF